MKQDDVKTALTASKPRRKDLENFGMEHVEPGDNARYLRQAMVSLDLPPIDISDPEQVWDRAMAYLNHCADNDRKPQLIGLANWLGVSRDTVNRRRIQRGHTLRHD